MITFKKQGDGRDSWVITYDDGRPPEIVFEDPSKTNPADKTVLTLVKQMSPEALTELKELLK